VIPHSLLWNTLLANGNDGTDNLMCVAELHLDPNHNVARMQHLFRDVVFTCPLTKTYQPVIVTVSATDDAMRYRLKAYPLEPKEQSRFISDLTARAADVCAREGVRMVSKRVAEAD
jgi:hypothetical protein